MGFYFCFVCRFCLLRQQELFHLRASIGGVIQTTTSWMSKGKIKATSIFLSNPKQGLRQLQQTCFRLQPPRSLQYVLDFWISMFPSSSFSLIWVFFTNLLSSFKLSGASHERTATRLEFPRVSQARKLFIGEEYGEI